jgi:hypothetical protein
MTGSDWKDFTSTPALDVKDPVGEFADLQRAMAVDSSDFGVVCAALDACALNVDRAVILETRARLNLREIQSRYDLEKARRWKTARAACGSKRPTIDEINTMVALQGGADLADLEDELILARGALNRCKQLVEQWAQRRHDLRALMKRYS